MNAATWLPGIEAVIFDLDGLLIDSERPFLRTLARLLVEYGAPASNDELLGLTGKPVPALVDFLFDRLNSMKQVDRFRSQYSAETKSMIRDGLIKAFPGAYDLLDLLNSQGIPTGLATSSYASTANLKLAATGLAGKFTIEVTGDQVTTGKPDPEIYLLAAEKLGQAPESCLVLEDSVAGITAASAAGMYTVAVASTVEMHSLRAADAIFESLEAFLETFRPAIAGNFMAWIGKNAGS